MRWFLGLLLVIALVGGALYGVGRFLLPNDLEVTRTVAIERPRASVFALVNDLRIAKEWSPFYARDPDADYSFSGEPGQGQSMRWVSTVREVGRGRLSIIDSIEYEQVEAILEIGDRATLNSRIELRPMTGGTSVGWTVTAGCGEGWINVPCRYMNLVLRGMIQRELDSGLSRLKTLTEQLPNVDFEGLNPRFDSYPAQSFVYINVDTSLTDQSEIARAENIALQQLQTFMSDSNLTPAGPLMRVRVSVDRTSNRMVFHVGYPYQGGTPTSRVGAQLGQTPTGQMMHVLVEGSPAQVEAAYRQMYTYLCAHRAATRDDGLVWEVVHRRWSAENATPTRIEILIPLVPDADQAALDRFINRCKGT